MAREKMTEIEKEEWNELYQYVKKNILGYTDDMKLSKTLVMRLKGLKKGQFFYNKKHQALAEYSYGTILLTFKLSQFDIFRALKNVSFKNESHKINYLMTIIENNINSVVLKQKAKVRNEEKLENKVEEVEINNNKPSYKRKTKEIKSDVLKELW